MPVRVQLTPLLLHLMCGAGMVGVLYFVDPGPGPLRLVLRMVVGASVFALLLLAVDGEARGVVTEFHARFRR